MSELAHSIDQLFTKRAALLQDLKDCKSFNRQSEAAFDLTTPAEIADYQQAASRLHGLLLPLLEELVAAGLLQAMFCVYDDTGVKLERFMSIPIEHLHTNGTFINLVGTNVDSHSLPPPSEPDFKWFTESKK